MAIWKIIIIIYCALCYFVAASIGYSDYMKSRKNGYKWDVKFRYISFFILSPLYILSFIFLMFFGDYLRYFEKLVEIYKHGGYKKYKEWKRQLQIEREEEQKRLATEQAKDEEIKAAYLAGKIKRDELPRLDGIKEFEFEEEMNLSVDYHAEVREIVYVENEYCESLNDFFIRHKDLRLYHMYKFVYLPRFSKELSDGELIHYMFPDLAPDTRMEIEMDSSYPLKYLWYPEEAENIKHGMMFFVGDCDNHGAKYTKGCYYPLNEGDDEDIISQLDAIVKNVHSDHTRGALYSKIKKPEIEEGSTDNYADELFMWISGDPEIGIIVDEVREKVKALKERGMAEKIIRKIFQEEPKLSRLVITKDMRIFLSDYNNMEIKMEPINKAVFLLFLRHPEGIVFKYLPDHRKELAEIYQMIKPLGLNERVIKSIEDVTNPCLNSINEKCARIRGAFVSLIDDDVAWNYYITGWRGQAKKIALSRDMVVWEDNK